MSPFSASANKQLQRTVTRHHGDAASAPFHFALASRITRQRAAAELRRFSRRFESSGPRVNRGVSQVNADVQIDKLSDS